MTLYRRSEARSLRVAADDEFGDGLRDEIRESTGRNRGHRQGESRRGGSHVTGTIVWPTPPPVVVVSGQTAAGKTTLARRLAASTGLDRVVASDRLVTLLGGASKRTRLLAWLTQDLDQLRVARHEVDRLVDLETLTRLRQSRGCVVESVTLPWLLAPDNTALVIRLSGSAATRAGRVQRMLPELTLDEARTIVDRKDNSGNAVLRSAWGVVPDGVWTARWRADLAVGCPRSHGCVNDAACAGIVADLVEAAYRVYRCYLDGIDASQAAGELRSRIAARRRHVQRCSRSLTEPTDTPTLSAWQHRLLFELRQTMKAEPA